MTTFWPWGDGFNIFHSFKPLRIISVHLTPGLIPMFAVCTTLLRVIRVICSDNAGKHIITLKQRCSKFSFKKCVVGCLLG